MLIKISRGYELIEGTWQDRDGSIMSITDRDFGKAPYSVRSVSNDGNYTVVTISVNGGRSINTLTFDNNNPNYMMGMYSHHFRYRLEVGASCSIQLLL